MAEGIETRINLTKDISQFLNTVVKDPIISRTLKSKIRIALSTNKKDDDKEDKQRSIAYDVLTEAHEFYTEFKRPKKDSEYIELHDLVKSSKVFNETIPEPVRSPELVERLRKLKAEQEQKEYDSMVKNVKVKKRTLGQEIGGEIRTTRQQISTIVNFLLSVGGTFAFGYVSSQYAFSDDMGARIILSIVLATVVALAELYFMARIEI